MRCPVDGEGFAAANVAEADRGLGRRDSDGRDVALARHRDGFGNGVPKSLAVGDHVVGRKRTDDHVGVAAMQDGRREPDRGRRLFRLALEHNVRLGQVGQLLLHRGAMGATRDDHDASGARQRQHPVPGVAKQGVAAARKIVQELGRFGPRQRPEP